MLNFDDNTSNKKTATRAVISCLASIEGLIRCILAPHPVLVQKCFPAFLSNQGSHLLSLFLQTQKNRHKDGCFMSGGERGIRTLDTLLTYTHFPGVRLQPLSHLSGNLLQPIRLRARILAKISASARILFRTINTS